MLWRRQEADGPEASVGSGNRDATGDLDQRLQRAVPGLQGVWHLEAVQLGD